MSVSNQTDKIYGSGNGVTTAFSYPFKVFDTSQLVVYTIITATGVTTGPLILNTDYTVTISSVTEGGVVTFIVAPPIGTTWFIKRTVPYTQTAIIPSEGTLPGKQIENQLDLITMMVIQDQEAISRAVQFPLTYTGTISSLPLPQFGLALGWDANGNLTNISATGVSSIVVPITDGNLATISSAGKVNGSALTGLGTTPAAAGILPVANLPVGTLANNIVQLNGSAKLPAVDGSLVTNLPAKYVDRGDPAAVDFTATSFTKDGGIHTLDLSGIVPAGAVSVLLYLNIQSDTAAKVVRWNKNGNTNFVSYSQIVTQVANVLVSGQAIVACDSNRVVRYLISGTGTWATIDVAVAGWWI